MGFNNIRLGHPGAPNHIHKRASASCTTGGFYKSPTNAQQVDSSTPLNITWDTSCLNSTAVDIYLYAPGAPAPRLHVWETVNYLQGTYQAALQPKWWNASSTVQLQLAIVAAGTPPFASTLPAGPVFSATYTKPTSGAVSSSADTTSPGSAITKVNNFSAAKTALAPGKTAAAVLMPLLFLALIVAAYFRVSRARGKAERRRWSQAVDRRMSTISTDWKSLSAAGASAAIRSSIAAPGSPTSNRNSAFSFGAIRPASSASADGGQAGIGAHTADAPPPQMSQLRSGARAAGLGERVSRVSFATDPRPSVESRRGASRAFHTSFAPPVPLPLDGEPRALSPTQTAGALALTPEDIRARIAGQEHRASASVDALMPALSMMRHDGADSAYLFNAPAQAHPAPPTPAHAPTSPVGMMPMQPMPANVMSPDEMLRAYAERRQTAKPVPAVPAPAASYHGGGRRTLYSARASVATAGSRYSEDGAAAYAGTAE
jgi:hypothetical protein